MSLILKQGEHRIFALRALDKSMERFIQSFHSVSLWNGWLNLLSLGAEEFILFRSLNNYSIKLLYGQF